MISPHFFSNKNIAVLGFGVEGRSALNFLLKHQSKLFLFDEADEHTFDLEEVARFKEKGVDINFGKIPSLESFDLIVRSPGVPLKSEFLQNINKEKITSVTKLFFDLCPCPIIGVTGTKGKGTTSSMIYEMLKTEKRDAFLGGNIGVPALDFLDSLKKDSVVVLELSSFQLMDLHKSPHIAVMLMVTSEHLDYHKDIYEYVESKRNILRYQNEDDYAILNRDYPATNESDIHTEGKVFLVSREGKVREGCFVENGQVILRLREKDELIIDAKDILLPGKHNWENVCAAVLVSVLAGVSKKSIVSVLNSFKGLEHRLELVRIVKGVKYYDDSFSTTPETAEAAIEAFGDPQILILGGSSKNSDFTRLGELISSAENIKAIIGVGEEWSRINSKINKTQNLKIIEGLSSMREVVQEAAKIAEPGDVVLLSPACASFDMFKNYKDRGDQFKAEVNSL